MKRLCLIFLLAFLALGVMIFLTHNMRIEMSYGLRAVLWLIVVYNINFGIFNLIPLPPLDGVLKAKVVLSYFRAYQVLALHEL